MPDLTWRDVWQRGIAPQLPLAGLEALAAALRGDSAELIEDQTVAPLMWDRPAPAPEGACAVAYALWRGEGLRDVEEVEEAFHELMLAVNLALDPIVSGPRPATVFVDWFDDPAVPRRKKFDLLLVEVEDEIERRKVTCPVAACGAGSARAPVRPRSLRSGFST